MARTKKQIIKDAERIIEVSNEMSVHKLSDIAIATGLSIKQVRKSLEKTGNLESVKKTIRGHHSQEAYKIQKETLKGKVRLGSMIENGGYIIRNIDLGRAWVLIDANDNIVWNTTFKPYKLTGKEKLLILSRNKFGTEVEFVQADMPEKKLGSLITAFYVKDTERAIQFTYKIFGANYKELKSFFKSFSEVNKSFK